MHAKPTDKDEILFLPRTGSNQIRSDIIRLKWPGHPAKTALAVAMLWGSTHTLLHTHTHTHTHQTLSHQILLHQVSEPQTHTHTHTLLHTHSYTHTHQILSQIARAS